MPKATQGFPGNVRWSERPRHDRVRSFRPEARAAGEKDLTDGGSAIVLIIAEESRRVLLVRETDRPNPLWKFPGGCVERGESLEQAAIREAFDETGIAKEGTGVRVRMDQLVLLSRERWEEQRHFPAFFSAMVTEDQFNAHGKYGDENGRPIEIREVHESDLLTLPGLLPQHRRRLEEIVP